MAEVDINIARVIIHVLLSAICNLQKEFIRVKAAAKLKINLIESQGIPLLLSTVMTTQYPEESSTER